MTDTKHTPGPWAVEAKYPSEIAAPNGLTVCSCWHERAVDVTITLVDVNPVSLAESAANARLIAAAPELLEALENLLRVHEGEGRTKYHAGDIARAAIAKAKGEGA